jgi:sulfoxide reductase heme-binding subunit YedZ
MESITAYVISGITTLTLLLIAALIASSINFERGSRPRDAARRRIWYWVIAVLNPALIFLLGYYIFKPDANVMIVKRFIHALSIGAACGFAVYLVLGFVLSKIYKNGKIGHWF